VRIVTLNQCDVYCARDDFSYHSNTGGYTEALGGVHSHNGAVPLSLIPRPTRLVTLENHTENPEGECSVII